MSKTSEYFIYGALFGTLFPVISTCLDLVIQGMTINFSNALEVQRNQPLHWVINTAPLFLGIFAGVAGRRQDAIITQVNELKVLNARLEGEYRDRVKAEVKVQSALKAEQDAHELAQHEHKIVEDLATSLQQLFEGMPVGAAAYGSGDNLLSTNQAFQEFLEGHEEIPAVLAENLRSVDASSDAGEIQLDLSDTVKHALVWRVDLSGIRDTRYWIILIDLTEQKNKESQLIQTSKLATLGELAAGTAHELNQPLNHIKLITANISRRLEKMPDDAEFIKPKIETISSSVDRAAKIINHMRSFGRASPVELEPVSVPAAVGGALTLLTNELTNQYISVENTLAADLPQVQGIETQLEQVFLNILGNAIDAIHSFKPDERTITVAGEQRETQLRITVRDTGGGLSTVDLNKIFDPFYTTKEVGKGTGLGGSISYGIVSSFGGTLSAANWEKGAEITLSLVLAT